MSPTTQTLKRATLLCCSLLSAAGAQAQPTATAPWPVQPVRLLVGFTAGGPTDIVARALAEPLGKGLGQPVIVDNRPGANAIIAAQAVAQSKDGHTLLMAATNHTMISAMYSRQIQFDPVKSFKAVCRIGASPTVLVVGPQAGLQRLGDFLAKAKSQARAVTYASPGQGSSVHFAGEDFAQRAGVQLTHVPYKGAAPALADVMAGQVTASFASLGSVLPAIKSGKLLALAVASPQRDGPAPGAHLRRIGHQGLPGRRLVWRAGPGPDPRCGAEEATDRDQPLRCLQRGGRQAAATGHGARAGLRR